jgi:hypothetical protein
MCIFAKMKIFKRLFRRKEDIYPFKIIELDEGDAMIVFDDEDTVTYVVDLDWDDGVMDIEFRVYDDETINTTNLHHQYKILRTVSLIVRTIIKGTNKDFHTVVFKASKVRDGKFDSNSGDIRNRFFSRYVLKEYPNATVSVGEYDSIIINLK